MHYFKYVPNGAVRYKEELLTLIEDAKLEHRAVRLYAVQMDGETSEYLLTSKSIIIPDMNDMVQYIKETYGRDDSPTGWERILLWQYSYGGWIKHDEILKGWNIEGDAENDHYLFTNKMLADKWSHLLKTDPGYREYNRIYQANLDFLDAVFDGIRDEDLYWDEPFNGE